MEAKLRKRILIVSPFPPAIGGISISSIRLHDRLVNDGYIVDKYDMQTASKGVFRYVSLLTKTLALPFVILFRKKYDLIHLNISSYWRRIYLWLTQPMFKRAKVIVTFHHDVGDMMGKPFVSIVLRLGDRLVCVRKGNRELLPASIRSRVVEIPAFIMPVVEHEEALPDDVAGFADRLEQSGLPLFVFNGAVIVGGVHDLYGLGDFTGAIRLCREKNIAFGALIVINDRSLSPAQQDFVDKIKSQIGQDCNVMICGAKGLSLISLFNRKKCIYVRPTKTDGDSLAVREALAMGQTVVASDVSPRPDGTILYHAADGSVALADKMIYALTEDAYSDCSVKGDVIDFYKDIVGVYNELMNC